MLGPLRIASLSSQAKFVEIVKLLPMRSLGRWKGRIILSNFPREAKIYLLCPAINSIQSVSSLEENVEGVNTTIRESTACVAILL